jgi:hypothetical protein
MTLGGQGRGRSRRVQLSWGYVARRDSGVAPLRVGGFLSDRAFSRLTQCIDDRLEIVYQLF